MALRIRLRRMGTKKRPFYRILVAEAKSSRDGECIDFIGYYNPLKEPPVVKVDEEKALQWLRKGAKPSETVKAILDRTGVWQKFENSKSKNRE